MFHDVAHNPNVVRSYPRPLEWWLEGTATLAAGTIRGCTGNPQCQEIQLDPRPRWGLPRLDIGFFDETSYQGYDAHPYRLQEFWLYLATEAGATNLGFLLPLFEVEGGPSATLFDTLLQNGDMNGFVVEGGFAELHYNWVTSILGHTDDSTGGGYGDEDRVCTTCAVPDGNRFGNTTGILPDAEGNAAIAVDLAPLSTAIYRLELADGQILADVIAGLDLNDPNGHLIYFLFEAREMGVDVVYLVVVNTNIDPAGGTSSGVFNLSLKVPDADTNPCQGAACPDAEPSDGSSWGDPHIFTFDGGTYTFMATGDYILSESTDPNDDFVVQVRFRPFEGPTWAHVDSTQWSANEAVAMNINGDIVEFYAVDDYTQPLAIINGTEVPTGDAVIPLPNGGTVTLKGRRASASWPDGTSLTAELNTSLRGDWSIAGRVNLSLPASRWNKVQGLMGNNDGIVKNDLRLRDGTQLSLDPTPQAYNFSSEQLTQELYSGPFRSSWLVQSYESLFSRGTNRYDPFYPSEFVSLDTLDPSLIAIAEHACGLQGVTSAAVLSRCVLDVANTGDEIFAVLAAAVDPQTLGITLSPSAIYFTRSESRELTAFVRGQVDNRNVIWSASAGSISGSGNTITYMPPSDKGEYTVTATLVADPSISATATIIVGEPLVIAPNTVTLSAESSQTFTAFGAEGQSVVWSASGGYISGSGRTITYTALDKAGDYTVTASLAVDSRVQATATVRVYGSKLTPFITTLKPGDSREFTWLNAEGLEPTWSVTGGSITGSGHSVTYTAPAAEGEYTITATSSLDPNLRATARVFVTEKEVATILYYADYFLSTDYLGQAMRSYNVTYAESWWDFDEKLASGEFDLAIALVQNWFDYPDVDIMTEHVNRGGRVIYTDWAHDFRFNELFEFRHSGWVNFNTMVLHSPFDEGLSNPMHLINPGWYIYSMGLEPIGSGQSFCTFASSNYSCLVVGNEGRTIVLGFLADVPVANGGEQLFSNIVNFFNVAFEPASSTSFGNSSAAEEPTFAPSGKADETELCYPANNLLCQTSP